MTNEVDVFLEHHGVKGQKWGIRNDKNQNETPEQRKARQRKNVQRVRLITGLAVTALYVSAILKANGKKSISEFDEHVLNKSIENPITRDDKQKQLHGAAEIRKLLKKLGENTLG